MALTVLKLGGSLANNPEKLRFLMEKLVELSRQYLLLIVPGGGEFADTVRSLDTRFNLSSKAAHRMAILAMDQYGLLLADLSPKTTVVRTFEDTKISLKLSNLSIFLPASIMFSEDSLENSWNITSDSISLYIAHRLGAQQVLLITDVDGVFESDPKQQYGAKLIDKISANQLSKLSVRTSVDTAFSGLLMKWPTVCYVVNGIFPERIETILAGKKTLSTLITNQ